MAVEMFKAVRDPRARRYASKAWIVIADDPENTVMDQGLTKKEAEETARNMNEYGKAAMTT